MDGFPTIALQIADLKQLLCALSMPIQPHDAHTGTNAQHIHHFLSPPGASPGAARAWARPEVRDTWGCTARHVSRSRGFIVQPHLSPTPPRARASVHFTLEANGAGA